MLQVRTHRHAPPPRQGLANVDHERDSLRRFRSPIFRAAPGAPGRGAALAGAADAGGLRPKPGIRVRLRGPEKRPPRLHHRELVEGAAVFYPRPLAPEWLEFLSPVYHALLPGDELDVRHRHRRMARR